MFLRNPYVRNVAKSIEPPYKDDDQQQQTSCYPGNNRPIAQLNIIETTTAQSKTRVTS